MSDAVKKYLKSAGYGFPENAETQATNRLDEMMSKLSELEAKLGKTETNNTTSTPSIGSSDANFSSQSAPARNISMNI